MTAAILRALLAGRLHAPQYALLIDAHLSHALRSCPPKLPSHASNPPTARGQHPRLNHAHVQAAQTVRAAAVCGHSRQPPPPPMTRRSHAASPTRACAAHAVRRPCHPREHCTRSTADGRAASERCSHRITTATAYAAHMALQSTALRRTLENVIGAFLSIE